MTTLDFITELFCRVDDRCQQLGQRKHTQARLWPSEVVTLALLSALKGAGNRPFYRWLVRDYAELFPQLPSRTRLLRLFKSHQRWSCAFWAEPSLLGVIDTYGIELRHPIRQGRRRGQLGAKGLSNHRWIVGIKLGVLLDHLGRVIGWAWAPANLHDKHFAVLAEAVQSTMLVLADQGFHAAEGDPANLKICPRGRWNDRMVVETVFSMLTVVTHAKKGRHRAAESLEAHLAFALALFNILVQWHGLRPDPQTGFVPLSIAEFSL